MIILYCITIDVILTYSNFPDIRIIILKNLIKLFSVLLLIPLTYISCTTGSASLIPLKEKAEKFEIHFETGDFDPELFYFSEIIKNQKPSDYISFKGISFADNFEIERENIIGMSLISANRLAASDKNGNITIYEKKGKSWEKTRSLSLKTEETSSFSAFSADSSYLSLYSGKTDSIYMFKYSKNSLIILKLYSEDTSFNRDITDIDMESGYIYLMDTKNRVSIIDYREKKYETEFFLDSKIPLRSFSVISEKESSSLAALSPGTDQLYIYPLSEQYMMVKEKGYIKKAGITSFNYGTHVLVSDSGKILYALKSSILDLSEFLKGEVTVTGKLVPDYPVDGGPEFLEVADIWK